MTRSEGADNIKKDQTLVFHTLALDEMLTGG